ncbi:MAG: helix-turn-helix domain-containing protein, partial [Mycobacterium sp.]
MVIHRSRYVMGPDLPPLSTGPAVLLTGGWLAVARHAVHVASIARRRNGLPESRDYAVLFTALTDALSRTRQHVIEELPDESLSELKDELTVEEAMAVLGKSRRSVQRLAPRLGGRLIGGRWILDRRAVEEHHEGSRTWTAT